VLTHAGGQRGVSGVADAQNLVPGPYHGSPSARFGARCYLGRARMAVRVLQRSVVFCQHRNTINQVIVDHRFVCIWLLIAGHQTSYLLAIVQWSVYVPKRTVGLHGSSLLGGVVTGPCIGSPSLVDSRMCLTHVFVQWRVARSPRGIRMFSDGFPTLRIPYFTDSHVFRRVAIATREMMQVVEFPPFVPSWCIVYGITVIFAKKNALSTKKLAKAGGSLRKLAKACFRQTKLAKACESWRKCLLVKSEQKQAGESWQKRVFDKNKLAKASESWRKWFFSLKKKKSFKNIPVRRLEKKEEEEKKIRFSFFGYLSFVLFF